MLWQPRCRLDPNTLAGYELTNCAALRRRGLTKELLADLRDLVTKFGWFTPTSHDFQELNDGFIMVTACQEPTDGIVTHHRNLVVKKGKYLPRNAYSFDCAHEGGGLWDPRVSISEIHQWMLLMDSAARQHPNAFTSDGQRQRLRPAAAEVLCQPLPLVTWWETGNGDHVDARLRDITPFAHQFDRPEQAAVCLIEHDGIWIALRQQIPHLLRVRGTVVRAILQNGLSSTGDIDRLPEREINLLKVMLGVDRLNVHWPVDDED